MALAYEGDNARSKRSYIATTAFNGSIYQYTTQLNSNPLKNEGKLTALTLTPAGAAITSANCPAGRILREIGAKLYPGVHPGLAVGDTFSGAVVGTTATNHYWIKVFDAVTGVRGYIDPNNTIFTVYNSDKSIELIDAAELAGGAATRLGQPVLTAGNVTLGGQLALTGTTKAIPYVVTTSPYNFSTNLGPFYSFAAAAAVAITATGVPPTGTTLTVFYSGAFTTTPGTGFVGAAITPTGTQCIGVSYVSNGTVLIETSRSGALPTVPTFP